MKKSGIEFNLEDINIIKDENFKKYNFISTIEPKPNEFILRDKTTWNYQENSYHLGEILEKKGKINKDIDENSEISENSEIEIIQKEEKSENKPKKKIKKKN